MALVRLDEASAAARRLGNAHDEQALHDFRVALRRLRSSLRSLRPLLDDTVPRQLRRRLRRQAEATGGARDAEVAIAWLRAAAPGLSDGGRAAARRLAGELAGETDAGYARARRAAAKFPRLAGRLRGALASFTIEPAAAGTGFGSTAARLVLEHAGALAEALGEVRRAADDAAIHRARIAAKRLRYLLEPLRPVAAESEPLLAELRRFQDCAGRLHDAHVLAGILRQEVERSAADRAARQLERTLALSAERAAPRRRPSPRGAHVLASALRRDLEEQFAELEAGWLGGRAGPFFSKVENLARGLAGS